MSGMGGQHERGRNVEMVGSNSYLGTDSLLPPPPILLHHLTTHGPQQLPSPPRAASSHHLRP